MKSSFKSTIKNNKLLTFLLYPIIKLRRESFTKEQEKKSDFLKEISSKAKGGSIILDINDYLGSFEIDIRSHVLHSFLIYGDYERDIVTLIKKHIDPKKDVLDIGANIGLHTVLLSRLINPEQKVLAFEPTPNAYKYLQKNLKINKCDSKVIIYNGIATNQKGEYEINVIEGMEEYSAVSKINHPNAKDKNSIKIKVQGNTVDSLVKENNLKPGLIKIDTEGAEFFVFEGAKETIKQFKPIIISELSDILLNAQGLSCERIFNDLIKIGYKIYDVKTFKPVSNKFEGNFIAIVD